MFCFYLRHGHHSRALCGRLPTWCTWLLGPLQTPVFKGSCFTFVLYDFYECLNCHIFVMSSLNIRASFTDSEVLAQFFLNRCVGRGPMLNKMHPVYQHHVRKQSPVILLYGDQSDSAILECFNRKFWEAMVTVLFEA